MKEENLSEMSAMLQ